MFILDILKTALASFFSIIILFILAKIMGHKQVAQLDFFDYIVGITIGSIAAELSTELENPEKPLIAMVIYGAVSTALNLISSHFPKTRKYINGAPSIIFDNGKLYYKNLKKAKLDLSEFMLLCREKGFFNLGEIQTAVFENNGKLTVLPTAESRPATPRDMNLAPEKEQIFTELIMDGRIMGENLKRLGKDEIWLKNVLKKEGKTPSDVLLMLCDKSLNFSVYTYE